MPKTADIHAQPREKTGPHTAKVLRKNGRIPGVFYFHNEEPIHLSVDEKELRNILHQKINVLNVIFPEGKERKSVIREIQKDPITDTIIHIDLMGVKLTEKVHLTIPILLTGEPVGVEEGGILEHLLREVEVEGLPLDIPDHIEVDVSDLKIGDVITLRDVEVEKIKIITDLDHAVANVIHPKVVTEKAVKEEEVEEGVEAAEEKEAEAGEKKPEDKKEEPEG